MPPCGHGWQKEERGFWQRQSGVGRCALGRVVILRKVEGGEDVQAEWTSRATLELLLTAMMPANALAIRASMATGLRIGDVLALRTDQVRTQRFSVKEQKTGKVRRVYLPTKLCEDILRQAGRIWAFEGRSDPRKHRTRDAVYKDLRRVATLYRVDGKKLTEHISPHTARKVYAVEAYQRSGSLRKVQQLLNHDDEAVTRLYALADVLTARQHGATLD